MNELHKAMITKELFKAQDAVRRAMAVARRADAPLDFSTKLNAKSRELGALVTETNGGPVKISVSDLVEGAR